MGGTYRNNNGTIENLSGGNVVDQTLDSTSEHAVSNMAVTGKFDDVDDSIEAINTNLDKFDKKSSAITPASSGKDSLLRYILDVVDPMNLSTYSFPASTFTDLPNTTSTFVVTVSRDANAFNVVAYEALSASKYYVRAMGAGGSSRTWIQSSWDKLALESNMYWTGSSLAQVTVPNNTYTKLGTITFPKKGVYIVRVVANWLQNSSGGRFIGFAQTYERANVDTIQAVNGMQTIHSMVKMFSISNDNSSIDFYANQTSGNDMTCYPYYEYTKLK